MLACNANGTGSIPGSSRSANTSRRKCGSHQIIVVKPRWNGLLLAQDPEILGQKPNTENIQNTKIVFVYSTRKGLKSKVGYDNYLNEDIIHWQSDTYESVAEGSTIELGQTIPHGPGEEGLSFGGFTEAVSDTLEVLPLDVEVLRGQILVGNFAHVESTCLEEGRQRKFWMNYRDFERQEVSQ